jgi:hypothetical protein
VQNLPLKLLSLILFAQFALGQVVVEPKTVILGKTSLGGIPAAGTLITINAGGTSGGLTSNQLEDPGTFANDGMASPLILSATNPTLIPTCYVFWGTAQPGSWSCSLYKGGTTPGLPDGATKVCTSSTQSNGATLGAYTSIALNSCPGSLTGNAGDFYWLGATYTSATTQLGNTGFQGSCPNAFSTSVHQLSSNITASTITPWPSTWPASLGGTPNSTGCYAIYVQLQYSSTNAYDLISVNPMACDQGIDECTGKIPPTTAGHGFLVMAVNSGDGNTITSVKAQIAGVNQDTLTQVGVATDPGGQKWYFYWIDRVTAGVDGVDCIFGGSSASFKTACISLEIRGTALSSAVDKFAFDSATTNAASFTSATTATTTQATELLIGGAYNHFPQASNTLSYITPTAPWTAPLETFSAGNSPSGNALFAQIVTSTGAYNLSGTNNTGAGSNAILGGLVTLK